MFRVMRNRVFLAGVLLLLVAAVSVVCLADEGDDIVNINPYKIVLNAEGAFDDVQANIPFLGLSSARIEEFYVTLSFEKIEVVVEAESARYCEIDDMLIIGFDRTDLQDKLADEISTTTTVTATVDGYVTVINEMPTYFKGSDTVEVVKPGKKK